MKKNYICLSLALLLAASVFAWGNPAQKPIIPSDAKWMIHFDMAKFRDSSFFDFLMEESFTRPFRKWNARLGKEVNMDVVRDMDSITLFNTDYDEDSLVALFKGRIDRDFLLGKMKEDSDFEETKSGKYTLLHWDRQEYAVFAEKDLIAYSKDRWAIENAMKALAGSKSSSDIKGIAGSLPANVMMFAHIKSPKKILGLPSKAGFADKIGSVLYYVSENGDMVRSYLKIETSSKADAENLRDIFKGLIAVARLQAPKEFEGMEYLDSVQFNIDGSTMEIKIEAPAEELFKMLRTKMKLAGLIPQGAF
jgi:hypothetical protein